MAKETHVVVLPYAAFGHMLSFYQLTLALAKHGVHIHYVSTPNNIARLPTVPENLSKFIHFVSIPMPVLETCPLPTGAEATLDISAEQAQDLIATIDLLRQPFKEFVESFSPDWLIIDFLAYWAAEVGNELGVSVCYFSVLSAATMLFFGPPEYLVGEGRKRVRSTVESLTVSPPWVDFPSSVAYRPFEAFRTLIGYYGKDGDISGAHRVCKTIEGCAAVAIRSCNELEGDYIRAYAKAIGKPVIPTGLLIPELNNETKITDQKWIDTFHWLDTQKERSLTFVGFGSECKLKKEEIYEIARGLELSELPFLWALRKPTWASEDETDLFPPNFIQNTSGRGKVCFGWAPQMEILRHPSVGASLFHSGWGSVIETIQFGHCLVVLPLIYDQGLNARALVEKGLAIEVERGVDGTFNGEGISKALKQAVKDKGNIKLEKAASIASDRELQEKYMDEFVKFLKHKIVDEKK